MEKQKRWQFYLILVVILLTLYNILPTVFYYAKPLKKPINAQEAAKVEEDIIQRINSLEGFTVSWLKAQCKNLKVKPIEISLDQNDPRLSKVVFAKQEDANFFAQTLLKAGAIIPFVPAELTPVDVKEEGEKFTVVVQRKIGVHLNPAEKDSYFHYVSKKSDGSLSPEYRSLVEERAIRLADSFAGDAPTAKVLVAIASQKNDSEESLLRLARQIVEYETTFGEQSPLTKRYFASFTQIASQDFSKEELLQKFQENLEKLSKKFSDQIASLTEEKTKLQHEEKFLSNEQQQNLDVLSSQKNTVEAALAIVKRNGTLFTDSFAPLTSTALVKRGSIDVIDIGRRNPFVDKLAVNWDKETIDLVFHSDVEALLQKQSTSEVDALRVEKLQSFLFNAMGSVARETNENITEGVSHFSVSLNELTNSTSLLLFDLKAIAKKEMATIADFLNKNWNPHSELSPQSFPFVANASSPSQEKLGLVFYSPLFDKSSWQQGFHPHSLYVILRGFEPILRKYDSLPDSKEKKAFEEDFTNLSTLLRYHGFSGFAGAKSPLPQEFASDYIFELPDAYSFLIAASRENFSFKGNKDAAFLEFTDVEQRLLTNNKIETRIHEDLVKWKDEHQAVAVSLSPQMRYDVPAPTQNVLLSNLRLSAKKYFRGDDRKILKWGLDLSGGKTVRIGLKDENGQMITSETDVKEAINELYERVNKLGVSEVSIRQEGSGIVLDFPGSQGLSAQELVKASAMYFHVVNEKFAPSNPLLREAVNTFLEEVWNEAVITNRKDAEGINEIAWERLGGSFEHEGEFFPATSHAKLLYDNGLRLVGPKGVKRSSVFDDTLSQVALFRGENFTEWQGQAYPLLIVFNNYALAGSNLTDIQSGYDASEGNLLYFSVKNSDVREGQKINPRDDFYAWTSQFSEEKIVGTPKEQYSNGRGWRMAVILNGTIVSAPTLNSALRDSARITGHFSQREINSLVADLKAGSLSFTPYILSEENVSPDLGKEQRTQGIVAAFVGVMLVIITMCVCYRFGGVIACIAVLFNLLIIWAVLQNLSAALTLPGIAGIILTVGMAVDANVLVFERIREEFAKHGRLPSAIQAGYRKAFSAIVDSNLTTIIAALILLNFDSGPIKGFALTLIIGIVSSMFTSLFMTRYFFAGWVQNPQHKELKMAKLFHNTTFNFMSKAKAVIIGSIAVMVVGLFLLVSEKATIFGMDFTGGYALTLDLQEKPNTNYRLAAENALIEQGADPVDFQIRELSRPTQLRFQISSAMEEAGKPFHNIEEKKIENPLFSYQSNPRIVWIVQALEKEGLEISPSSLPSLSHNWSAMSGQLSDSMRTQALIGLVIAFIAILIYITFRFEFLYAISATIALVHDVLITLAILAIMHLFYSGMQIDLQVIAALMTIVGYSLNDTIIIFDRIREDVKIYKKHSFSEIVNHALNATLNRTIMTSGTTLLVLLALVALGGKTIFGFSLILAIGVGIGTLSSLYVAAPLLVYFHMRAERKAHNGASQHT